VGYQHVSFNAPFCPSENDFFGAFRFPVVVFQNLSDKYPGISSEVFSVFFIVPSGGIFEPVRMFSHPRVVRRTLDSEIHRHFHAVGFTI
jgi:hypothetical protein